MKPCPNCSSPLENGALHCDGCEWQDETSASSRVSLDALDGIPETAYADDQKVKSKWTGWLYILVVWGLLIVVTVVHVGTDSVFLTWVGGFLLWLGFIPIIDWLLDLTEKD